MAPVRNSALLLLLLLVTQAQPGWAEGDGDLIEISGSTTEESTDTGGEPTAPIDVGGSSKGEREQQPLPDDGLLPKWCRSAANLKCDVPADKGTLTLPDYNECLFHCQEVSCQSAQYVGDQCLLSSKRCEDGEMVAGKGTYYHRMKEGEEDEKCPGGMSPVGLSQGGPIDQYCKGVGVECPAPNLVPPTFAATSRQCTVNCNSNRLCRTAHFRDKQCYLRGRRCSSAELIPSPGALDFYRLKNGETCPPDRPLHVEENIPYTAKFCMLENKECPEHNLYKNPLSLSPLEECLAKCNRIKTCGSVDFYNNKCVPKDYRCADNELTDSPGRMNLMRLQEGEECPGNRKPPPKSTPWSASFCTKHKRECPGHNMEGMPLEVQNLTVCLTKCVHSDGCLTAHYDGGQCSLKDVTCPEKDLKESNGNSYSRARAGEPCPEPAKPPTCQENASYKDDAPACPNTCADQEASKTCEVESLASCTCNEGFVKAADSDECVPVSTCGCKDDKGEQQKVGASWRSDDCSITSNCLLDSSDVPVVTTEDTPCGENEVCSEAKQCVCAPGYKIKDGTCQPVLVCGPHSTFEPSANACPNVCHHTTREAACEKGDKPGCPCKKGYILDTDDGTCVPYSDCGCKDEAGHEFKSGDQWLSEDCSKQRTCNMQVDSLPAIGEEPAGCPEHASCKGESGRGECGCDEGYTIHVSGVCEPAKKCEAPTVYNPKGSLCPNTCRFPEHSSTCENTGPSCECPTGSVLYKKQCVKSPTCPCYDEDGEERYPKDSWMTNDCQAIKTCEAQPTGPPKTASQEHACAENMVCDIESGFPQCVCMKDFELSNDGTQCVPVQPPCEETLKKRVQDFVAEIIKLLSGGCGACSNTCQNPNAADSCPVSSKICSCREGFLFDEVKGKCIPSNECNCFDEDGVAHEAGSTWMKKDCTKQFKCIQTDDKPPKVETADYHCVKCSGSGVCLDEKGAGRPEPLVQTEALGSTSVENKL